MFLIHEDIINENELQGLAGNKSLEAIVNCVDNRISFRLIRNEYDLAATYAVIVAVGRAFNDGNKRTAFSAMDISLRSNSITLSFDTKQIGEIIVKVTQGFIDEVELARFLRKQ